MISCREGKWFTVRETVNCESTTGAKWKAGNAECRSEM